MKKSIIAALVAVTLTFTACGNVKSTVDAINNAISETANEAVEQVSEEVSEVAEQVSEEVAEQIGEEVAEVVEQISEDASEVAEQVSEEVEALAEKYTYGELTEDGYKNAYLGYQFTAPEGCIMSDETTLAMLVGMATDVMSESVSEDFAKMAMDSVLYEMYASYPDGTNIVSTIQANTFHMNDIEAFVDANISQLNMIQNMEISVVPGKENVVIAGHDFIKVSTVNNFEGTAFHQDTYLAFVKDMIMNFTISYKDGNEDKAEALFNAITVFND